MGGRAVKGSRRLIQNYVNDHQDQLNELHLMNSPSLLSFIDKSRSINCKSPLKE